MKKYISLLVSIFACMYGHAQDSLLLATIDQTISANEEKASTIYQKIERSRIETLHGKNPTHELTIFKMTADDILLSETFIAYSINDTSLIITYFFNNGGLIKVSTTSFNDFDNHKSQDNYYFRENKLVNKEVEGVGPYAADRLIKDAKRILKELKKRPIKFPT